MFKVYAMAQSVEDDWHEGEIGRYHEEWPMDVYGRGKTVEEALDDAFENLYIDTDWRNNLSLENDSGSKVLLYCQEETRQGTKLTPEEIEDWKAGKIKVYATYYRFHIREEKDVALEDLKKLNLAKY